MAYKIVINDTNTVELGINKTAWDIAPLPNGQFHILFQNRSYTASVLETNFSEKTFKIRMGTGIYTLQVKDDFDQLAEKMGMSNTTQRKANTIKAPMPGLVLSVLVAEGQSIKKGESVAILEAMKMENVIKAPNDGTIKSISVQKGNAVEKNQILIELA